MKIDLSLMYVTDCSLLNDEDFFTVLKQALEGGASIIQHREKNIDTKEFYDKALKVKQLCSEYNVPFIINDRVDIAMAVDADGVHLGQKDMPIPVARNLLGEGKIIGLSVSNTHQALEANQLPADYIGISPIFGTQTKTEDLAPPLKIKGLIEIKKIYSKPIVCIGGINTSNTERIISNGADGIAVVSAISKSQDPKKATEQLKTLVWKTGTKK